MYAMASSAHGIVQYIDLTQSVQEFCHVHTQSNINPIDIEFHTDFFPTLHIVWDSLGLTPNLPDNYVCSSGCKGASTTSAVKISPWLMYVQQHNLKSIPVGRYWDDTGRECFYSCYLGEVNMGRRL